jgi:hypothetical protein
MKLFEVDESGEAIVNKPWISLIPEFQSLFRNTQNQIKYDYSKGRKYLSYIYFVHDFSSPLKEWQEDKRIKEALRYTDLTQADVKQEKVQKAVDLYKVLQLSACRAHRSYLAAQTGLDKMDEYFETMDLSKTDKQGKLLYTPSQYIDNIAKLNKAYDELDKLSKRVETELTQSTGIRGTANLGERELMRSRGMAEESESDWNENNPNADSPSKFVDLAEFLNKHES